MRECWICGRQIVDHDDIWIETTVTVHGDGKDRSLTFSACNDPKCVATGFISMSASVQAS